MLAKILDGRRQAPRRLSKKADSVLGDAVARRKPMLVAFATVKEDCGARNKVGGFQTTGR